MKTQNNQGLSKVVCLEERKAVRVIRAMKRKLMVVENEKCIELKSLTYIATTREKKANNCRFLLLPAKSTLVFQESQFALLVCPLLYCAVML